MNIIIYAGGVGSRLWPLSRENSPKQFDKIFNGKSTIQLAIERVAPDFGMKNIFIQTVEKYKDIIKEQLPELRPDNILIEPERRNLGPAVCFTLFELQKRNISGSVALLWADHLMERTKEFVDSLKFADELIKIDGNRFIFLAERPRFANNNLGWIKVGDKSGELNSKAYYSFAGWKYKPEAGLCDKMYRSGEYFWNPGYFVTSINFLLESYQKLAPEIYQKVFNGQYGKAEAIHFDRAIIEKLDLSNAIIIKTNMGWSDPGTLYALKEALEENAVSNVVQGKVLTLDSSDNLLYNFENNKILAGVGLNGMVVVNTEDAIIVVPKDKVVMVTELVKKMRKEKMEEFL